MNIKVTVININSNNCNYWKRFQAKAHFIFFVSFFPKLIFIDWNSMREKRCNQLKIESTNSCEGKAGVIFDMHQKNSLTDFMNTYANTHAHWQTKWNKRPRCQMDMKIFLPRNRFSELKFDCYYRQCDKIQYVCSFLNCMRHYLLCTRSVAWVHALECRKNCLMATGIQHSYALNIAFLIIFV